MQLTALAAKSVRPQSCRQLKNLARRRPLLIFFLLAYCFGWLGFLPLVLSNLGLGIIRRYVPIEFIVVGASGPTLAALCTQWLVDGSFRICRLCSTWRRLLLGALVGLVVVTFAYVVLPAILLVKASPRALHWSVLWTPAVYAVNWSTFLGGPLNEEPGWRGFALPRLQARFGPAVGSILLGALWAGWHLPLFLIHFVNVPVWAFTIILVTVSVFLTWATNLSGASVIVPIMMHAAFNTSSRLLAGLCGELPTRQPDLPFYLAGGAAAAAMVIFVTRGRLGRSRVAIDDAKSRK